MGRTVIEIANSIRKLDYYLCQLQRSEREDAVIVETSDFRRDRMRTIDDAICVLEDQDNFNRWLAHLVAHEDNEGGAEAELICRKLAKMGYVKVKDGHYKEVFSEDEDERDA